MINLRRSRPLVRIAAAALAGSMALPLVGCYQSLDVYPFESRTWSPKTVVLIDTRTEEELWRYEAPVGTTLTLRFHSGDEDNLHFPDELRWKVKSDIGTEFSDEGTLPVPPEGVRRVDWYLRPAPEYPKPDAPRAEPAPLPDPAEAPQAEPVEDPAEPAEQDPA